MARMMLLRSAILKLWLPPTPSSSAEQAKSVLHNSPYDHQVSQTFPIKFKFCSCFIIDLCKQCLSSSLVELLMGNQLHNTLSQSSRSSYQDCDCKCTSFEYFDQKIKYKILCRMDNDLNATFEACNNFNKKLKDTIKVEAIMKILKKWEFATHEMDSWTKLCTYLKANLLGKPYPPTLRRQS